MLMTTQQIESIETSATPKRKTIEFRLQPIDRSQGIPAFVRAGECGSFSLASRQLGLSASSVGKAVARLEQRLGVRLFERTTRRMALTDEGQAFHASCLRALAEIDAAESELSARRALPMGRLRIALPTLYGRVRVLPVLAQLLERHPTLQLDLLFSSRTVDLIEEHVDLALRIGTLEDSATQVARPLGAQALCLCAAPAYLERRGTPSTLEALRDHDAIAHLRAEVEEAWQLRGSALRWPHGARLRLGDLAAVRDAALAGQGIAQLPGWFVEGDVRASRLQVLLPHAQPAPLPIHLLWSKTTRMTARQRVCIDALIEGLAMPHGA